MSNTYRVTLDLEDGSTLRWEGEAENAGLAEGQAINNRPDHGVQVESSETTSLRTFRVCAAATTYCYLEVNAVDADEALSIGKNTDGGSFTPDTLDDGDWNVRGATLVEPPAPATPTQHPKNAERAEKAFRSLRIHYSEEGTNSSEEAIVDILTDLRHLSEQYGTPFDELNTRAETHYQHELERPEE